MKNRVYTIISASTKKIIAEGTLQECAEQLKMQKNSLLTRISMEKKKENPAIIAIVKNQTMTAEESWNSAFGWYRASKSEYPCTGCTYRSVCEFSDTYCKRWEAWYKAAHNAAADAIKR